MSLESDLQTVLSSFPEVSEQLQLSRTAAPGQKRLWNESEVEREEKPHDGKRPGEFAPKGKPKTPAGQNLLFDSGVKDQPVAKPVSQPSTLEKIADEQSKSKIAPAAGQGDLFLHSPAVESWASKRFSNHDHAAAFLRWFGGSKTVGEDGNPLTLYHGTRGSFDQFTPSKSSGAASYFTVNPNVAHSYAVKYGAGNMDSEFDTLRDKLTSIGVSKWDVHKHPEWRSLESVARSDGASIVPVHLAIRNPYVLDGVTDSDKVNAIKDSDSEISRLKSMGYDGILVKNALDRPNIAYNKDDADSASDRSDLWITFSPSQIKSATGNSGEFSSDDKRISFSRALNEITPVEFSVAAPPRKRRVIDDKRTHEDVDEDEKIFGKKKRIPTDGDKPETGWTKVGGSSVHVNDDGVIDKGCPGLKGEAVEDLIDESDESRERREARQAYARAAGITGDQITAQQAKAMGSEQHVEGMKQAKAVAEADPRPTIGTSDVLRGVDDQTGEPAGNGHELLQSNNREHPESNEQFEGTGMPSPMKFMPDEDEGTRPQWMGPKLSEMVPIPPPPKFLRDRQPIDHDEAATYKPKIAQLEADIEHWRNARDAMKKGHDISQFNLAPEQKSLAFADAKIKELKKPLDQLKRKLSDYTMRSTPNQNPKTQTWTSMDSAAQGAEAKFGIPIHHITAAMPDAYLFRLAQSIEHEALKKAARDKTKLDAGDISRIGNQYKDWSTVPRFDEASREFAGENPNAGFDPYAHDTPERVWNLIHEGATVLPPKDSPEIAELAAQMISGDYNRTSPEFASEDDEKPVDDWGHEEHGDTSFDPNSFSRSLMNVVPVEFARVKPARNQSAFNWDEDAHPREASVHDGKKPGEFAPSQGVASPQQIADPETDYKQNGTRSKSFKAWFGDWEHDPANASKVVDADGEPQGTASIPGEGSKVMKDGKPIGVYHGTGKGGWDAFDKAYSGRATSGSAAELYGGKSAANENLASMGFDGITHIGGDRMGGGHHHRVWIAFEPNQIKAVNNRGTFNPEDDRLEFSRSDELDTIAERMGVDADSLRAAIAAMPGPKEDSLIWVRKLMRDPSRGVLRDRNGHVVGFLTRNGQKIELRDSRGRQSGTVTGSSFRDSKGHVTGSFTEFSRQLQEMEPVEFARMKPSPGQMSLFDEGDVNRESTQHDNKRPGEFAPKTEPATTAPAPQKPRKIGNRELKAAPSTTVDFPQTNSFGPIPGVKMKHIDGTTFFTNPKDATHVLAKVPTHHVERFMDEISGRLTHPANSGHPTLDRVLSGNGKHIGKGHESTAFDAGNGMIVKAAVLTPYHISQHGVRTPDEANKIVDDTVAVTKHLRSAGVPGILPQYGVQHDGRSFAVQKKVDTTTPLQAHHFDQLEKTIQGIHNSGYAVKDQIQAGLDHNGNAAIYDIGSASKLEGGRYDDDDKRQDFSNLSHLAKRHGVDYKTPEQRRAPDEYDTMLWGIQDHPGMTPNEARTAKLRLVGAAKRAQAVDPGMHELLADNHADAMKKLEGWIKPPQVEMSRSLMDITPIEFSSKNGSPDSTVPKNKQGIDPSESQGILGSTLEFGQLSFEWDADEHPRDEAGRFKDKLHHQIKEYLSDGSHRHLRDIHDHTGHKDYDALDPLANKANAALKELRDSGQINGTSPSIGEPHFHMTEEQIAKHKNPDESPRKPPVGVEVSDKDELKSKEVGRTRSAIHFDPAIVGPSGATLTSYEWRFEWVMDDEKSDDPIRVSDWNESERNEHTKRQIVHVFNVTDPDGDQHFVSLETAVKLLGLVKKSEDLNKVKSLAQAAIKLAQAKQEHEKLLGDESQKSEYGYKFKVQTSEEKIKDLQSKMEFLNSEAAMIGNGKSPVEHYRDVARKLQSLIKLYRSDKHGTSQQDRVTEFVKAKGGLPDQQKELRIEGYGHYKKLIAANGMNVLGESKSTTPNIDGEPEKKIFGRTVAAEPAWSDQKMRLWYAKHGKNAEAAIADSHKWLADHHPDYSVLLEHPDFKMLRDEQEFSRLLDITPVEFARKPAPGQKGFDFDAPATEPIADKAAENEPTKQSSLFADIPAEHLDEAKKLSEMHGGREVKKTKTGWQVRAPKDGKVSEVTGVFFKGGQFMPIHGLTEEKEPQPKRQKPALPFTPPKPNENGREREPRSPMSPEQIEELRKQREDDKAWGDIQRTPLGRLLELGDKPKYKQGTIPITDLWREYAERVGPTAMAEMKGQFEKEVHGKIDKEWQDAIDEQSGLTDDQIMRRHGLSRVRRFTPDDAEWDKNQLKESAHSSATEWKPRTGKAIEKSVPGTHYVRELIGHILSTDNGLKIGEMKRIGEILASHESASRSQMADPAEAKRAGYYPNKFPGTTASGKKVKAGDGWVKKNQQTGKYETYTDDEVKSAVQQFSRDLEICLQEFARHEFSSTQFNISDAGYSRSQGSPLDALVKLAKSIPTEELHEGERSTRDDMHITVKYGLHTSNSDEVAKIVRGFGPVTVKLGKTSIFPANEKKSYDVVKVAVTGDDIHRLNKLISDSTECTDTWPDFKPHLTIAYVMPGFGKKYAGLDTFEGMELTFDTLQFSNKEREKTEIPLVDKTEEFSRLDWIENRMELEFARRRPDGNQNSFGWSDEEQETPVQSSNVHSFAWEGPPATGNLLVRFKNKQGGSGPLYRYHGTPHAMYDGMAKAASKGKFVWDSLRMRGTVSGHQFPYSLIHTGDTKYVPRQAGLRRGYTGEHFMKRTLNGVESQLAPAPVKKGPARRIPGYDPNKLKFPGEATQPQQQATVQSQTSSGPTPPPVNTPKPTTPTQPAQPQTPAAQNPQAPPSAPPNKTKGLIDKVLDFFKKKRKKPDDPKQFSRAEWDAYESLVKSGFV